MLRGSSEFVTYIPNFKCKTDVSLLIKSRRGLLTITRTVIETTVTYWFHNRSPFFHYHDIFNILITVPLVDALI